MEQDLLGGKRPPLDYHSNEVGSDLWPKKICIMIPGQNDETISGVAGQEISESRKHRKVCRVNGL